MRLVLLLLIGRSALHYSDYDVIVIKMIGHLCVFTVKAADFYIARWTEYVPVADWNDTLNAARD